MTPNVLDTSRRRIAWARAFPAPAELILLAEADAPPRFSNDTVFFIHETDFGCIVPDEHLEAARLAAVTSNYGGNTARAKQICSRIIGFRQILRASPSDSQPTLILYSGDKPADLISRNPRDSILKHVLPRYAPAKISLLPQTLDQTINPIVLRRIAATSIYSTSNSRCLTQDLITVELCLRNLKDWKDLMALTLPKTAWNLDVLAAPFPPTHQDDIVRFLAHGAEPAPWTLLEMAPLAHRLSQGRC